MSLEGKKLGVLISVRPEHVNFRHAIQTIRAARRKGITVYAYCIDEGVWCVSNPDLQALCDQGLVLYACAYGAQRRSIPLTERANFAGLTVVNDLVAGTDRFVSFN